MTDIRVLLLEDNTIDSLKVQIMLAEAEGKYRFHLVGVFDTLPPVLEYLQQHEVDIVISDIFIKSRPLGLDLLHHLPLQNVPIILTTSSQDKLIYANAQRKRLVHYLVKPFHGLTLQSILEKALDEWEQSKQHDFIDHKFFYLSGLGGQREQVSFRNIIYLASESNNCFIFTDTKKYVTKKSLTKILNEDLGDGFLRIHQQYIVNKLHLKIIKPNSVVVKGEIELPIGKSYRKEVNDFLKTS